MAAATVPPGPGRGRRPRRRPRPPKKGGVSAQEPESGAPASTFAVSAGALAPDALRAVLNAADSGSRANITHDLQAATGNRSIQRLLDPVAQRDRATKVFPPDIVDTKSGETRKTVEALKKISGTADQVRAMMELVRSEGYKEATYDERLWMIRVMAFVNLHGPMPRGFDPVLIKILWESFGTELIPIAADNMDVFKYCYNHVPGLAALPQLSSIRSSWETDVKATANSHLSKNASLVRDEMARVGLSGTAGSSSPKGSVSDAAPQEEMELAAMVKAAKQTLEAEKALEDLTSVPVGWITDERDEGYRRADTFNPNQAPGHPLTGDVRGFLYMGMDPIVAYIPGTDPQSADSPAYQPFTMQSYAAVKQTYDALATQVAKFMNDYPAVYAAKQAGSLEALSKADIRQAKAIVGATLQEVQNNIVKTVPKLRDDDEFWLKLKPIHDQLVKGMNKGPSGMPWTNAVHTFIAKDVVKNQEDAEFWKDLGVSTLAAAAFLVAELATAGGATFFLAASVGAGITGYQTYKAWDEYYTLAAAAGSEMSEETELVYPGQVEAAKLGAILQTAFAFLDIAGPAAHWAKAAKAGLVPKMAMKGAAAADVIGLEGLVRRVGSGEVSHAEAAKVVERAVGELGVEGAARRAGVQPHSLLIYVGEDSATGRRIAEHMRSKPSVGAATVKGRPRGYKPGVARKVVKQATDDYPEGLAHYGLNAPEARASYEKSLFEDPNREAGIWMDLDTNEHIVVQGDTGFVSNDFMLDPEFAGRRFHLMEHYHPTGGVDWQLRRYPSMKDYEALMKPYWGSGVEPPNEISTLIRWADPKSGKAKYTTIGYDPTAEKPFWLEFEDPHTGELRREQLDALLYPGSGPDYRGFLDAEAKKLNLAIDDWADDAFGGSLARPTGTPVASGATTELAQQLSKLASLSPAEADKLLSRAIEEIGPAEALKAANMDWKTLAATLPKPSGAGQKLLYWRDTMLADEIRGLVSESEAIRTGTIGSFDNDFDWNFLGSNATANRAKVVSFLSGRTGMSVEQMHSLLYADFFTDPRRMFLYEKLPQTLRTKVARRQAGVERQLIWNNELSQAVASGNKELEASVRARMERLGVPEVKGGVKLLSPEDIRVAEAEIDRLHAGFEKALARKDYQSSERIASAIADRQAMINAASPGAYASYGAVRKYAVEREAVLAIELEGQMLPAGWHTAVIDQMPHLRRAVEDLDAAVTAGDIAAAMRSIGKYGDRMTSMANMGLAEMKITVGAFEELEWDFKLLYARAKTAANDAASLQSKIAVDAEGMIAKVRGLTEQLEKSSEQVLASLQKTADLDVLFEQVQLLTHIHIKFLKARDATYLQLTTLLKSLQAGKIPQSWISGPAGP
jgi:hypothetical protein